MLQHSKSAIIILPVIFWVTSIISVRAQEKQFAQKGITELAGNLSYSSLTMVSNGETGDAVSIFSFAPQVGYFAADGFEIGLSTGVAVLPGFSVVSPEDGESTSIVQLFLSPAYNFQTSNQKVFPFIEAQMGYTSVSSAGQSQSGFSYGGRIGLKIIAVDHFLLSLAGQYLVLTFNEAGAEKRNGLNYLTVGIGVAGYF
jgi:hypothetical protein